MQVKKKQTSKKATKKNPVKVTVRRNGETKTLYGAAAQKVLAQRKAKGKGKAKKNSASFTGKQYDFAVSYAKQRLPKLRHYEGLQSAVMQSFNLTKTEADRAIAQAANELKSKKRNPAKKGLHRVAKAQSRQWAKRYPDQLETIKKEEKSFLHDVRTIRRDDARKRAAKKSNPKSKLGKLFKFKGDKTVFKVVKEYKAAGFIPSVTGHTLDGKKKTNARVADVVFLRAEPSKKRNAAEYSPATPIAVTKHFRSGGPGYATAREKIIRAGQRDLFAQEASADQLLGWLRKNPTVTELAQKRLGAERFKTASPSLLKQTFRQIIREAKAGGAPRKNPRYLVTDQHGNDLGILVAENATKAVKRAKGIYPGTSKLTATKVAQQDFIGGRADLVKKARAQQAKKTVKKSTVKKSARPASKPATRGSVARRNPEAGEIYESFTGMPSTGYDVVTAPNGTPANVDQLGQFTNFHWQDWNGKKYRVDLEKLGIPALLAANRNKEGFDALYALGDFVLDMPPGDHGYITRVEYRAQKAHLGDDSPRVYYHELGEETGEPPVLRVDKEGHMHFRGGAYTIEGRGIVN